MFLHWAPIHLSNNITKTDERSRASRARNSESLKRTVRLIWFPCTAMMTDVSLIERISRGGERERQEQEEAMGESS